MSRAQFTVAFYHLWRGSSLETYSILRIFRAKKYTYKFLSLTNFAQHSFHLVLLRVNSTLLPLSPLSVMSVIHAPCPHFSVFWYLNFILQTHRHDQPEVTWYEWNFGQFSDLSFNLEIFVFFCGDLCDFFVNTHREANYVASFLWEN